jgi:photosystem II stability/assembly factor-like uncharacterized protein
MQVGNLAAPTVWKRISVVDSNIVWVCGGYGSQTRVWRTVNGGANWTNINTNGLTQNLLTTIYAKDSLTAFVGETGGPGFIAGNAHIFKTSNGGSNWILIDTTGGEYGWISGIVFSKINANFGFIISDPPTDRVNHIIRPKLWTEDKPGLEVLFRVYMIHLHLVTVLSMLILFFTDFL